MTNGVCDVCKTRPASFRAQVLVNGDRRAMELCDQDYRKLARRQGRSSSPLESLFGGRSLLDEFFGDGAFGHSTPSERIGDDAGRQVPIRSASRRGGGSNIADRLSEQANALLQDAAQKAHEFGRAEVDTEHLLLALTGSEVVHALLGQYKIDADDLRRQIGKGPERAMAKTRAARSESVRA